MSFAIRINGFPGSAKMSIMKEVRASGSSEFSSMSGALAIAGTTTFPVILTLATAFAAEEAKANEVAERLHAIGVSCDVLDSAAAAAADPNKYVTIQLIGLRPIIEAPKPGTAPVEGAPASFKPVVLDVSKHFGNTAYCSLADARAAVNALTAVDAEGKPTCAPQIVSSKIKEEDAAALIKLFFDAGAIATISA